MANVDLHCHSRASDGTLSPTELVRRAKGAGVTTLALTDHDELGGIGEAAAAALDVGMALVPGVEISVTWEGTTVHVVGLGVDPLDQVLIEGLRGVRAGRRKRAERIAEGLAAAGIEGCLQGALRYVENPELISRTHFARYLVEAGHAPDFRGVFNRYLVSGKPGFVPHQWASLHEAVAWIRTAGGMSVVAHPARYKFGRQQMRRLLSEFKDIGGQGIEVVTSNHTPDECGTFSNLARGFGLAASRGSDFHGPGESRAELGAIPELPPDLKPVWSEL